jgi:hypothetical protein
MMKLKLGIPPKEGKVLLLDVDEGGLWASCFIDEHGQEGLSTRLLLANGRQQHNTYHKVLQGMPILR